MNVEREFSASVETPLGEQSPGGAQGAVPWQIWIVVLLLALEGLGNLLMVPDHPIALYWLSAKVLFITGLLKAWRWVFVLFMVVTGYHVIAFLGINIIASLLNLLLIGLVLSARNYFFPKIIS